MPGVFSLNRIRGNGVTFKTDSYELWGGDENPDYRIDASAVTDYRYVTINSVGGAVAVTAKLANGAYWSTFYSETRAYLAPEGTQVFAVKLDDTGEITLTKVSERIVDATHGVVLKQTTDSSEPTTTIVMVASTKPSGFDYANNNSLVGTTTSITNPGNAYVLGYNEDTGVGFYKLAANGTIGAGKAYLTYSGTLSREFFGFNEDATAISEKVIVKSGKTAPVYDLQGRRVAKPTNGLYIVDGKKVSIK